MKKEIIVILTSIILIIGVSLIYVLLNPKIDSNQEPDNTLKFGHDNYVVKNEQSNFIEYQLNDLAFLDVYIENFNIVYKKDSLKINDHLIADNIFLFKRCGLYSKSKLVLFIKYLDKPYGAYIIYNTLDDTFEIIDTIDGMYIMVNDNIYFENIGFTVNIGQISEDKFIKDNNSVCNIKDNRVIQKYIEVYYDQNSLKFDRMEDISSLDLEAYKKSNGYC